VDSSSVGNLLKLRDMHALDNFSLHVLFLDPNFHFFINKCTSINENILKLTS
jgi:hypothetical protein